MNELKTKGFVELEYPSDLRAAVEKAVKSWKQFCALPDEVKGDLSYSNGADGVGYEFKNGVGPKADRKENFDLTSAGQEWVRENITSIKDSAVSSFVQDVAALVKLMKPTIVEFARRAEEEFNLEGFASEVEESEPNYFTRFIHYFGSREVGEEIATAHADQSGFTLHLFESDDGLQCLTFGGKWVNMPVSEGKTVIIPSMQMQLRSKGELKALCHRVVATPDTASKGRFSAVCFVQFKNTPKYDKDKGGRLQEKAPGFNYAMSHADFVQLFK